MLDNPMESPEAELKHSIDILLSAQNKRKTELDWQEQFRAIINCRRLARNHADVVCKDLHRLVVALMPNADSLRSNVVKVISPPLPPKNDLSAIY